MTDRKREINEGIVRCVRLICTWLCNHRRKNFELMFSEMWGKRLITSEDITYDVLCKGEYDENYDFISTKEDLVINTFRKTMSRGIADCLVENCRHIPNIQVRGSKAIRKTRELNIDSVMRLSDEDPILAALTALNAWSTERHETWCDDYFLSVPVLCDEDSRDSLVREIDLGESFNESTAVKRYVGKLREKVAEAAGTEPEKLEEELMNFEPDSVCYDVNRVVGGVLKEAKADPFIPNEEPERKKIFKITSDAVTSVCHQYIHNIMVDTMEDSVEAVSTNSISSIGLIHAPKEESRIKVLASLKKRTAEIDGRLLLEDVLWAMNTSITYHNLMPVIKKRFTDSMEQDRKAVETRESRLKKNFSEESKKMRREIRDKQKMIDALQKENEELKKSSAGRDEMPVYRGYSKDEKTIRTLHQSLDEKDSMIAALQEKVKVLAQCREQETDLHIPEGKFMFVVSEDHMKTNLKAWFPECIISDDASVVSRKVDLVVVICKSVSHAEYYRIKGKCRSLGIPYVHCNHVSYPLICRAITEGLESAEREVA